MKFTEMHSSPAMYRQGDVLIERIAKLPQKLRPVPREGGKIVLAHGEATGHAHAIANKGAHLFVDEAGVTFLEIAQAVVALQHEEHGPIKLERGIHRVTRQREYHPTAIRNVAD